MVAGPEQRIQTRILRELKKRGIYAVKIITASRNGVPDILCCYRGRFIGIEVKTPKGRLSAAQDFHLKLIDKAGGVAVIARSWEDVFNALNIE